MCLAFMHSFIYFWYNVASDLSAISRLPWLLVDGFLCERNTARETQEIHVIKISAIRKTLRSFAGITMDKISSFGIVSRSFIFSDVDWCISRTPRHGTRAGLSVNQVAGD